MNIPQVTWLKNSQIKYGWLKALLFIICYLSFGFISYLLLTIFGGEILRSVLKVLGLYFIYRNNLWFPISLNFGWNCLKRPLCNYWNFHYGMNTIFNHDLNAIEFENSILLTALIMLGIIFVHKRYNSNNRVRI